jgi:hypothetical protein
MKTAELTGAALDWAVTQIEYTDKHPISVWRNFRDECHYSTDWAQGGPIIEREKIDVFWQNHQHAWVGSMSRGANKIGFRHLQYGNTPLIAAMRCYVASKMGDEIEIPEELK